MGLLSAPVAPENPPAMTALTAEPMYSAEWFDRWPAPVHLNKQNVAETRQSLLGARMTVHSPTLHQLIDWKYECYEHYVTFLAYASP